jgi:hypothetical protein
MTLLSWILLTVIFVILGIAGLLINGLGNIAGGMLSGLSRGAIDNKSDFPWISCGFLLVAALLLIKTLWIVFSHITISVQ